ncbi:hypothetical protein [Paeniglutamicibacter sp. NPDC091659]|uniref:hypothetical protein n=1 Tax=Paeniglutamicibacter sp. NPDC091659 TaxID=3364389 RepID=UPI00381B7BDA
MKLPKRFPTKLILISAAIIGMGAGATTYMVQQQEPREEQLAIRVTSGAVDPADTSAPNEPVLEAAEAPVVEETVTNPSPTVEEQPAPAEQSQTYAFAAEMAAAGISEADFGTVTTMTLDQSGWRLMQRSGDKPVWRLAQQTRGTLTEQLQQVNHYVQVTYGGSWSAAHDSYVNRGNF